MSQNHENDVSRLREHENADSSQLARSASDHETSAPPPGSVNGSSREGGGTMGNQSNVALTSRRAQLNTTSASSRAQPEDYFLWVAIIVAIGFLGLFFYESSTRISTSLLETPPESASGQAAFHRSPPQARDGQQQLIAAAIYAMIVRNNAGFLVGTLISMVGCMIVLRGVRSRINGTYNDGGKTNILFATNSPGIFIVLLGTAVLLSTIMRSSTFRFEGAAQTNIAPDNGSLGSYMDAVDSLGE